MINRLRKAWCAVSGPVAAIGRCCTASLDKDDVFTVIGLALVAGGMWLWLRPLALIVPGAVLLWVFLPSRPPFVDRPPAANRIARRPPS